jgi:hypothetical protein
VLGRLGALLYRLRPLAVAALRPLHVAEPRLRRRVLVDPRRLRLLGVAKFHRVPPPLLLEARGGARRRRALGVARLRLQPLDHHADLLVALGLEPAAQRRLLLGGLGAQPLHRTRLPLAELLLARLARAQRLRRPGARLRLELRRVARLRLACGARGGA